MKLTKVKTRTIKEFTYQYDNLEELKEYNDIMLKAKFTLEKEDLKHLKLIFSQIIKEK